MNQMGDGGHWLGAVERGAARRRARRRAGPNKPAAKPRGTTATPGGLAARYFNRTTSVNRPVNVSRIPQSYYTRQNRYYPQVAR